MNNRVRLESLKDWLPIKASYQTPNIHELLDKRLYQIFKEIPKNQDIAIVCVGTDRSTGDSLGPLVGTHLQKVNQAGFRLYGTIDNPVHAMNLASTLEKVNRENINPFVVAIDASLGQMSSVGMIQIGYGPVKPGAGVNKQLPEVGNIHVTGIVNIGGFMEYFVLQNTRLSLVMNMAEIIAESLYSALMQAQRVYSLPVLKLD